MGKADIEYWFLFSIHTVMRFWGKAASHSGSRAAGPTAGTWAARGAALRPPAPACSSVSGKNEIQDCQKDREPSSAGRARQGQGEMLGSTTAEQSSAPAMEDSVGQGGEPRCKSCVLPSNYKIKCLLKEPPVLAQNSAQVSP